MCNKGLTLQLLGCWVYLVSGVDPLIKEQFPGGVWGVGETGSERGEDTAMAVTVLTQLPPRDIILARAHTTLDWGQREDGGRERGGIILGVQGHFHSLPHLGSLLAALCVPCDGGAEATPPWSGRGTADPHLLLGVVPRTRVLL